MTIQEAIDQLSKIEDKGAKLKHWIEDDSNGSGKFHDIIGFYTNPRRKEVFYEIITDEDY